MEKDDKSFKNSIAELMENLGTIGLFMLGEMRSLLKKSWGGSREEFFSAVDQAVKNMKNSGKWAMDDIERTASQVKDSWPLLNEQKTRDWDRFLAEVKERMNSFGEFSKDSFNKAVEQAKEALDKQWSAFGRFGEPQLKSLFEQSEQMSRSFQDQWGVVKEYWEKTGKKVDRAIDAAWEELKKKE